MKSKITLLITLWCLGMSASIAQRTLTGKVTDTEGEPLIGVNIYVKGNPAVGTISDFDGTYSLDVDDNVSILVYSYTGFEEVERQIGNSNVIDVQMTAGITLETAVVTALGLSRQEKSLGYGVSTVSGDELTRTRNNSVIDALSGKVAGLTVNSNSQPGGGSSVVVRGFGSVTGNNQALWVIDGVPVNNSANTSTTTLLNPNDDFNRSQDFGNQANDVNPDDIESLSVLKGAAATALYGSRAANGAIIVTTKSGSRDQGLKVDYSGSFTQSEVNRLPFLQNTFGQGWNGLWASNENGSWGPKTDGKLRLWGNVVNNSSQLKPYVILEDNLRDFYGYGKAWNHSVAVSGGNESASFRLSYSNANDDGVVPTDADSYKRNTLGFKGEVGDEKFQVSATVNYLNKNQKALATGQNDDAGAGKVLFQEIIQIPRDMSIVDMNKYDDQFYNLDNYYTPYAQNPYFILGEQGNKFLENRIFGNVSLNYKLIDNLELSWRVGGDFSGSDLSDWGNVAKITAGSPNSSANDVVGRVTETNLNRNQINSDVLLTYNQNLTDKINLRVTLGNNVNSRYSKYTTSTVTNLTIPGFYNLSNTTNNPISNSAKTERRLIGVFGIVDVAFDNWLYATLQARNDWSSTLPIDNNSFFYPAITLSAVLSDAFDLNSNTLSLLKVRASYAQVGNDAPPYSIVPIYTAGIARAGAFGVVNFPISGVNAFEVGDIRGNNKLQPEITTELEFGVDARFLQNRIGIDVAVYDRTTTDQIINVEKDPSSGYLTQVSNIGEIQNQGIELLFNVTPVKTPNFQWDIGYNFSKNESMVNSLGTGNTSIVLNTAYGIELRAEEGQPLGTIYSPTSELDPNGNIVVNSANGLPITAPNKKLMGSINPDFVMGLNNSFSYKDLRLAFNVDYRKGGVFWSYTSRLNYFVGNAWKSQYNDREPFVVPGSVNKLSNGEYVTNTTAVDRSNIFTYWGATNAAQENHVLDKTFFKLRNVSLTYELPKSLLSKATIQRASITAFGRNLILWTPSDNHYVDPEGSTFGLDLTGQIGEFSTGPTNASYGLTFNLSF